MTPWTDRAGRFSPLKAAVFAGTVVPAILIAWSWIAGGLGPRPFEEAIHQTGNWAVRFLLLSLAVTPFRRILRFNKLILVRRMLGLAALSYVLVHFALYVADSRWDLAFVAKEIAVRIYLTIGFLAMLGLIALGATSTDAAIRRLGGNWNRLHKIVYAIGILGLLHFFMQTKADVFEATLMAGFFILLMLYRLAHWRRFDIAAAPVLISVAALGALMTAATELAWYGLATGVPPMRVLLANLDFSFVIRPGWWALAAGLAVATAAFVQARVAGGDPKPGRKQDPRQGRARAVRASSA